MKKAKEQKGDLTLLEQEEHDIFHFILLLESTCRHTEWEAAWRLRMMGGRVRGAMVGRPMPDFTEVWRRWALPHHDHWSFPGRSVPPPWHLLLLTCVWDCGEQAVSSWNGLESHSDPCYKIDRYQQDLLLGDQLLEDLLKEQALFSWSRTLSAGVTFRRQVIHIMLLESLMKWNNPLWTGGHCYRQVERGQGNLPHFTLTFAFEETRKGRRSLIRRWKRITNRGCKGSWLLLPWYLRSSYTECKNPAHMSEDPQGEMNVRAGHRTGRGDSKYSFSCLKSKTRGILEM